ncbi:MAG: hypothetical protein LBL45_09495 [Treponema sp.]|nr:hypothetical protein [Treponema sp.]
MSKKLHALFAEPAGVTCFFSSKIACETVVTGRNSTGRNRSNATPM